MRSMRRVMGFAMACLLGAILTAEAQARGLDPVGEAQVTRTTERVEFRVGAREGELAELRLRSEGSPVRVRRVEVVYGNGSREEIQVRGRIEPGEEIQLMDLRNEGRIVRAVLVDVRPGLVRAGRLVLLAREVPADKRRFVQIADEPIRRDRQVVFEFPRQRQMQTAIKLRVRGGPAQIARVEIEFGNRDVQVVRVRDRLDDGEETDVIDLDGTRRNIRSITVMFGPQTSPRTRLQLFAAQAPQQRGPAFQVLDEQALRRDTDRVVFAVGRREGRQTAIRLKAIDGEIGIGRLEIEYRNGDVQEVRVRDRLNAGEETDTIDLKGEARFIDNVVAYVRPSRDRGARLQLLGQEEPRPQEPGSAMRDVPRGWVKLGSQTVDFGADQDVISVGRDAGMFSSIALRTFGRDVYIRDITVVYGNGERDRIRVDEILGTETRTQALRLRGDRFIDRIEFVYRALPGRGRGILRVEVIGEHSDNWRRELEKLASPPRWVLLATRKADMFQKDNDVFPVGREAGRFRAIKVAVQRQEVRIYGMRIIYGNGQVEDVPISGSLRSGSESPAIDLKGRDRFIDRIEFRYRSKLGLKGGGVVQVFGLQ